VIDILLWWTALSFPFGILVGHCISFGLIGPTWVDPVSARDGSSTLLKPTAIAPRFRVMKTAKAIVIEKCLSRADTALQRSWTFHNSTEALFWFRSVLKIDPQNTAAHLGSARAYQYIASQPYWYNDVRLARSAAAKALVMAEGVIPSSDAITRERALICGQVHSAVGRSDVAERFFDRGTSIDPNYSAGQYFTYFNKLFLRPGEAEILPGLQRAVELAEAEGSERRMAAAYYFKGFANTLFGNYHEAIQDLKRSMTNSPKYGSANLAMIAATALAGDWETYKAVRSFKMAYPDFNSDLLDYMWLERSSSDEYHRLAKPLVQVVKTTLGDGGNDIAEYWRNQFLRR
jgi:tetratricopeptide (TPR) repeat protein